MSIGFGAPSISSQGPPLGNPEHRPALRGRLGEWPGSEFSLLSAGPEILKNSNNKSVISQPMILRSRTIAGLNL